MATPQEDAQFFERLSKALEGAIALLLESRAFWEMTVARSVLRPAR